MTDPRYPAISVAPRTGTEPFHAAGVDAGSDVLSFWRWASSDLVGNTMRGVLAELLVAQALGGCGEVRTEWDACDLRTKEGWRIEVKSAAYIQSWSQRALSGISFDIAPKRGWDAATNTSADTPIRSADVYVFALLAHQDKETIDPLDLTQWHFYVASARALDARSGVQKRLSLGSLLKVVTHPVSYAGICKEVGSAITASAV